MSYDAIAFINHNLEFNSASELVTAVEKATNKKVYFAADEAYHALPEIHAEGWRYYIDEKLTIEQQYEQEKCIVLDYFINGDSIGEIWVSKHAIDLGIDNVIFPFERWRGVIEYFSQLAILTPNEIQHHPFYQHRVNLYNWLKLFGGSCSVIFCSDTNADITQKLWEGEKIEEVIESHKSNLYIINYPDFSHFKYQHDSPNSDFLYNHTLVIDYYNDLKSIED